MNRIRSISTAVVISVAANLFALKPVQGAIKYMEDIVISLSSETVHSEQFQVMNGGLFLPAPPERGFYDIWILSKALPVGLSWRPPQSATLTLSVSGEFKKDHSLNAFVRYSSDAEHWSTWYRLGAITIEISGLKRTLDSPLT